jgi:quercetin dioxygenase-like cupin family protein
MGQQQRLEGQPPMKVHNYHEVKPEESPEAPGASLRWVIGEKEGAPTFSMRVAELQPGVSTPGHSHDWEHEIFVLSGRGKVGAGGEEALLGEGDVVFIPPMEEHRFVNDGDYVLRFICAIPLLHK